MALVVIPCLNEAAHLDGLLHLVRRDPAATLIIVADGGSDDGSQSIVERHGQEDARVRLLSNPAKLQSAGVNLAVSEFQDSSQWLVRMDAHCGYPEQFVSKLLAAQAASAADAVVVPMITVGQGGFQDGVAAAQNSRLGTGGSAHRHIGQSTFVDHGHHALISIKHFKAAGGYCEEMVCNEDAELDHRLGLNGALIWLEASLPLTYFPRKTPAALWRQYFRYGKGRARNVRRHRLLLKLRQLMPVGVAFAATLSLLAPIHPIFLVPAAIWLMVCILGGAVIGAKSGGGWRYAAGPAAAIMHLSWGFGFLHEVLTQPRGVAPKLAFQPVTNAANSAGGAG
ncbi:MAG: succinoglycan biosynthesis protein exoa [Alphaproteobacteria bacterium PA3]|nr:MAG: succinoglycan biosynthesis protein exoa [Alphaproteobacteria bacterium PA3]